MQTVSRIRWGPSHANLLDMGWPLDNQIARRRWRKGSRLDVFPSGARESVVTGRDYAVTGEIGWIPGNTVTDYVATEWSGPVGVEAFLAWCEDGNDFRFVPDITYSNAYVDGCTLREPENAEPQIEDDGTVRLAVTILHPTVDLALLLRGILFEMVPGANLSDLGLTFTRASVAYQLNADGFLESVAAGVLRDGHYVNGRRSILLESARTNKLVRSQEFDNASWTKTRATITANPATDPTGGSTGDQLVEDATAANSHFTAQSIAITAGAAVSHSTYARATVAANRHLFLQVGTAPNVFSAKFDLSTGVATSVADGGTAVRSLMLIEDAGHGWYRCAIAGTIDPAAVSATMLIALTSGGVTNYDGDGASGIYLWQAQGEEAAYPSSPIVTTTAAVTRAADLLYGPFPFKPQDLTAYVDMARPVWATLDLTAIQIPYVFSIGEVGAGLDDCLVALSGGNTSANLLAQAFSGGLGGQSQTTAAFPAGDLAALVQAKNFTTAVQVRLDPGAGFGAWDATSTIAGTDWSNSSIVIVGSLGLSGTEVNGAIFKLRVLFGLRSRSEVVTA